MESFCVHSHNSCFLQLPLERLFLLALSILLGTCLPSLWSPLFPLHGPALILLSRQDAALAHLDSLPPYDLVLWTNGSVSFPFSKGGSGVPANCFLALRPLFPLQQTQYAQVFPLKPVPFCKLFAGLSSTNKSATFLLLLSESRSILFSIFPFTAISLADLARTVFSLLLYYQATMGPRILVSPQERRG